MGRSCGFLGSDGVSLPLQARSYCQCAPLDVKGSGGATLPIARSYPGRRTQLVVRIVETNGRGNKTATRVGSRRMGYLVYTLGHDLGF